MFLFIVKNVRHLSKIILRLLRAWYVNLKLLVYVPAKRLIFGSFLYLVFLQSYIFFINIFCVVVNAVIITE